MNQKILVTGGAGFIGSNLIRLIISQTPHQVLNMDKLTYAGNLDSLSEIAEDPRYRFLQADIASSKDVEAAFKEFQPNWIMNLAAETHVDRSIDGPADFIQTNIVGTFNLLKVANSYYCSLKPSSSNRFDSFMSRRTKFMVRWTWMRQLFPNRQGTTPTRPIQRAKRLPIIWYGRGTIHTAYPR